MALTDIGTVVPDDATVQRAGTSRQRGITRALTIAGAAVALFLLLPLLVLVLDAHSAGWTEIRTVLFRSLSLQLLEHTVELSVLVTALTAVIGTAAAWCTERTTLPGRKIWTVLLVLPVAMPDFVVGYAWHSIRPTMNPLAAATLVMTLSAYPLVYLPVAAALRRADPAMEETARSLGLGPVATFFRVTFPLIRTAMLGGCLIVILSIISEYGAFEILRFQTFTTEVFTEFEFNPAGAAALSIPLVLLGLLILGMEALIPRRSLGSRTGTARGESRVSLGRKTLPAMAGLSALVGLAVVVPVGTLIYWMASSQETTLPAQASLGQATLSSLGYSSIGALIAVLLAVPVAFMSARKPGALTASLERSTFVTQALPGVVIALCLVYFAVNYAYGIYETSFLLVLGYGILNFPLALVCVKTSVLQAPPVFADVARSLGRGPFAVFFRVTLPMLAPGLVAAFCLVFLTAVTELTATLVLAPLGIQTLTTQFWAFQSETSYGAAAPYGLVIVGISVVPGALLALWFDRERRSKTDVEGTA